MPLGLRECLSAPRSNSLVPSWIDEAATNDSGDRIAEALGCPIRTMPARSPDRWEDELPYVSPSAADPEMALFPILETLRGDGRVTALFTGYHGGKIWDRLIPQELLGTDIRRGDTSGLNLSEARLQAGVINVALPFYLGRSIRDLQRISASAEMAPWALGTSYDRPIPRRVLEDAGVGRTLFGTRKRAVIQRYPFPLVAEGRARFFDYLREHHRQSVRLPRLLTALDRLAFVFFRSTQIGLRTVGIQRGDPKSQPLLDSLMDLPYRMHLWALREQVQLLRTAMSGDPSVPEDRAGAG
jgi:hypothetical protein